MKSPRDMMLERVKLHADYLSVFGAEYPDGLPGWRIELARILEGLAAKLRGGKPRPGEAGLNVLRDIAFKGYILRPTPEKADQTTITYIAGRRDIASRILSFVFEDHTKIMRELEKHL